MGHTLVHNTYPDIFKALSGAAPIQGLPNPTLDTLKSVPGNGTDAASVGAESFDGDPGSDDVAKVLKPSLVAGVDDVLLAKDCKKEARHLKYELEPRRHILGAMCLMAALLQRTALYADSRPTPSQHHNTTHGTNILTPCVYC